MADHTAIEWTDATWSPIRASSWDNDKFRVGWHCEHVSEGCRNCYAERINKRLGTGYEFKPGHRENIDIALDEKMLLAPLRWKKPRMIFVCSMTDLFADFVKDEWIDRVFDVMRHTPQHCYQVLTKRAARMLTYSRDRRHPEAWPLSNVWLGVSAEDQQRADERIPLLLQTPAAVRFISAEPLLGPIDLFHAGMKINGKLDRESGERRFLDWVIVGGESGPHARPMHPAWVRSLRDQCAVSGVAFFMKQWGEWLAGESNHGQFSEHLLNAYRRCDNHAFDWPRHERVQNFGTHADPWSGDLTARRVGKRAAGRLLDGVEHSAFPERRP